ncbi:hypothetical protein SSP24_72040 [Streptomyces spinoverrucosus]|uniref:DUF742 domain-containing protein n=1 Tax=Streptomyces spinoverrucosus TaxID=284043 RepID=A0A4Y3VV52_9ACTN|nr:hypothetical protein SSP24_72040 [Streptomyces spinoverrucosus]GHB95891.1 hypothetical protein GCM10010397_80640 [Streptomyces spinoverrucosus]
MTAASPTTTFAEGWQDDVVPLGPRPYALTRGRTRASLDLAVEALVRAAPGPHHAQGPALLPEHRRIRDLCTQPRSVAEISALAPLPLGVARVLVADLAQSGLVTVHQAGAAGPSDAHLLERVLRGLRDL